jgi:hypothetical protein
MATEGFINNTQLDFATYKQSLKEYLQSQSRFQDYDFEASNLSVLLDILEAKCFLTPRRCASQSFRTPKN